MKYYKVCKVNFKNDEIELSSAFIDGKDKVIYKPCEWTQTHKYLDDLGYYLCVFESLKRAEIFINNEFLYDCLIFECEIEDKLISLPNKKDYDRSLGIMFDYNYNDWPVGTIMAKRVKLIGIAETNDCVIFGYYKNDIHREKEIETKYKKVKRLFEK